MTNHPTVYAEAARLYPEKGGHPGITAGRRKAFIEGRTVSRERFEAVVQELYVRFGDNYQAPEGVIPERERLFWEQETADLLTAAGLLIEDHTGTGGR